MSETRPSADVIASLVAGKRDIAATATERSIAKKLCRLGEKMERKGYLPEDRRRRMLEVLREECAT